MLWNISKTVDVPTGHGYPVFSCLGGAVQLRQKDPGRAGCLMLWNITIM